MSEKIRSIRGTQDILPKQSIKWQYVERVIREVSESYGFGELRLPTIEKTALFTRSVGETTDVVQKEMYTFEIGDESITLRPEGTAGTVRALLQNGMLNEAFPVKVMYISSCFRHENPQAGRYREFHQYGAESFGSQSPLQDAEIIAMLDDLLFTLGVKEISLNINSIGCPKCRPAYNKKLIEYYREHFDELCPTCQERLERNPLRLLDCKEEKCQPIKENAPKSIDNLCEECQDHFDGLRLALDSMQIPYNINPYIVRGLDYYTKTVFEFITNRIGAQGTVCGGGRYDGLVEEMGGPATPAFGFGLGIERLLMVMEASGAEFPPDPRYIMYIGSMGKTEAIAALSLACKLRAEGFYILCDTVERSVRAQMKYADKTGVGYSCIIGSNELAEGEVEIKNMETGESQKVKIDHEAFSEFLWSRMQEEIISDGSILESITEDMLDE